tara:strand:+ start:105 stop:353 length:249 start_codon:yes stop_codon:yes gene_type:complete
VPVACVQDIVRMSYLRTLVMLFLEHIKVTIHLVHQSHVREHVVCRQVHALMLKMRAIAIRSVGNSLGMEKIVHPFLVKVPVV